MNTQERINIIEKKKGEFLFKKPLSYKTEINKLREVYEVPLDLLLYNKYNGRIMSRVYSHEKTFGKINPAIEKEKFLIEQFLWKSTEQNKHTLESLRDFGQNEVGIITKDGIIIDGNRRACLLNIINREISEVNKIRATKKEEALPLRKFLAIILDDKLEDNPNEISALETIYQIGVDNKVVYNPIEKYLKVKELSKGYSTKEISQFMVESEETIKYYLEVLDLMERYLKHFDYEGYYVVLDRKEGHFVDLYNYIKSYKKYLNSDSLVSNWKYGSDDIDNLINIYFNFIRSGFAVAACRIIGKPKKNESIFSIYDLWNKFLNNIQDSTTNFEEKKLETYLGDSNEPDFFKAIELRDKKWNEISFSTLKEELEIGQYEIAAVKLEAKGRTRLRGILEVLKKYAIKPKEELLENEDQFYNIQNELDKIINKIQ